MFKKVIFNYFHVYFQPAEFASGALQSMADKNYCIDTLNRPKNEPIGTNALMKLN